MAFMAPPAAERTEDRMPVLAFNAKAGRLFLHDRVQQPDGEWTTVKQDVTMSQPAFAVDFGRLETGWIHFADNRAPQWAMAFYGEPMPAQPDSPGNTATGKPLRFKAGFRVHVIGKAIGGVRELAGNAGALINGMNELHTQYEESVEARAGKIPLVKMTDVLEVRSGQSSNFQPVFTILAWVDRPADRLGPRTVAVPGSRVAALQQPASRPSASVQSMAPVMRVAAMRAPAPPVRYAPPVDRWDDEPAPRSPAGVNATAWGLDDEIPF